MQQVCLFILVYDLVRSGLGEGLGFDGPFYRDEHYSFSGRDIFLKRRGQGSFRGSLPEACFLDEDLIYPAISVQGWIYPEPFIPVFGNENRFVGPGPADDRSVSARVKPDVDVVAQYLGAAAVDDFKEALFYEGGSGDGEAYLIPVVELGDHVHVFVLLDRADDGAGSGRVGAYVDVIFRDHAGKKRRLDGFGGKRKTGTRNDTYDRECSCFFEEVHIISFQRPWLLELL